MILKPSLDIFYWVFFQVSSQPQEGASILLFRNFDEETDNYYKKGVCYFNNYKTKDVYGKQSLTVPKELNEILKK